MASALAGVESLNDVGRVVDDYIRATTARTTLNAICRALSHPPDPDSLQKLRSERKPKAPE